MAVPIKKESAKLKQICVDIAKKYFNLEYDLPTGWCENPDTSNQGSYISRKIRSMQTNKVIGHKPLRIQLNSNAEGGWTEELILDVLKHEVCHWACQVRKKPYKDGSVFFESELLRIGATSTMRNSESSKIYQTLIAEGKLTRLGRKDVKYISLNNKHTSPKEKEFAVRKNDTIIGFIRKKPRGSYPWVNNHHSSKWYGYSYVTRKDAVEDMIEELGGKPLC